jgi:hypothetical protein
MKAKILLVAAMTMALTPALASAQTAPGQGQYNGTGYNHTNGPATTGQPDQSCEDAGTTPGHAADASGSAFNPDGNAGKHYAGEQTQNTRNSASVSQYDVACANQPQ